MAAARHIGGVLGAAALSLSLIAAAVAADRPAVAIGGQVKAPQTLTAEDIGKLPSVSVHVSYVTGHGQEEGTYEGALLWTVLDKAVLVDAPGKNARLRHTVLVTAGDGYAVALSIGEIAPEYENKPVILATKKDGKPLGEAGIRLVVPNDKHGGRQVRNVVRIDVQ